MRCLPHLVTLLTVVLLPGQSPAQPAVSTNLSWDRCAGDGRIVDRSFACDTNTGEDVFFGSAVALDGVERDSLVGFTAYVDVTPTTSILPNWWTMRSGECRPNALLHDWSGPWGASQCLPWFGEGTPLSVSGILSFYDRIVLQVAWALPAGQSATLAAGQEYSLFRVRLSHAKSTGTGACAGCTVPTCIGFGRLNLDYVLPKPREAIAGAGLNWLTWQGAYVADYPTRIWPPPHQNDHVNVLSCTVAPVPAQGRTWGLIKTMYR